jgi:hypothetical protein
MIQISIILLFIVISSSSSTTYNNNNNGSGNGHHHSSSSFSYEKTPQPPYDYDIENCQAVLLKEAEKLYPILAQEILCQSTLDYMNSSGK